MDLTDLTPAEAILPSVKASSKKNLLQDLSHRLGPIFGVEARPLCTALLERERLGSTGMGRGVAIPHCRMPNVTQLVGGFARLEHPIDFEAVDGEPVDLVYVLIAPENAGSDHLKALARISRALRDQTMCQKLRGARDAAAIYSLLATNGEASHAA